MFRGVNNVNIDAKGRISIPVRFREELLNHCKGEMVVTIDTEERCLLIYPQPDWHDIQRKVESLPSFNLAARRVQRLLIGHATDIQMDGSGRLLSEEEAAPEEAAPKVAASNNLLLLLTEDLVPLKFFDLIRFAGLLISNDGHNSFP